MDLESAKPIEIPDKSLFDKYFQEFPPEISELTFTNLFIWRNYYDYFFMELNDHLLIFSKDYLKKHKKSISKNQETLFFLLPVGPHPTQTIISLFDSIKNIEFHRIPEIIIEELEGDEKVSALNIKWVEDRDNWDYVYEREKLISLSGRKLYQKRKWLKLFLANNNYKFELCSKDRIDDCKQVQIKWCDINECMKHPDLEEEDKAIKTARKYYDELIFKAGILYIDEKAIAYTMGEKLNPDTAVIHIEKALAEYKGSYQAINNFFLKKCCEDVKFVNREQDLGDPGLRQAKSSYNPHHMVKKSIIYREA
ncbi:MAG: DUF2156 domain-containing protein [Candidatus Helarchaeota archaeon]|nr:DUF2156 domain-containing protein [Candidatus Helarchaeota archaeon]